MKLLQQDSPLAVVGKGALAGLVGTAVLTVGMQEMPKLMQSMGLMEPPKEQNGAGPTEELAERVAEGVLETSIDAHTREVAGQSMHWSYGALWGILYAIMQGTLHLPHHLQGLVLGGLTSVVATTVGPAMGLTEPPPDEPTPRSLMMMGLHLVYGWVTAVAFDALSQES